MDGELDNNTLKFVIVGESGVGKTSLITQFIDNFFDEELQTSTGASFNAKTLNFDNGKRVQLQLWDTAGQERYRSLTKNFFQNAAAVTFIYDITNQNSFDEIKNYWFKEIKESAPENIVKALVANKYDLFDKEEVDEGEARKLAEENDTLFFLTSAKSSIGVKELFIGLVTKIMKWNSTVKLIENDNDNENSLNLEKSGNYNHRKDTVSLNIKNSQQKKKKKKGCC
jgi:small GTP-binding protein